MNKYEKIVAMWRSWKVVSASDIDLRLHNFRILFAYHSGKIENPDVTYGDTREIFENGRIVNYTGEPRALFELRNQKLCYEFIKHKITAREPLTAELVKETHAVLTGGTYDERRYVERGERPGAFKKHDYVTGREEVGSMPEDVQGDMDVLLGEIRDFAGKEVVKAAAYFHARFEYIHPFADGNGRVGRTLLNYFLMVNDHPPIIVHDEDRVFYYAALEEYDKTEDISPLCDFLISQTEKTWKKSLEREERRAANHIHGQSDKKPSVVEQIRSAQKEAREQSPEPPTPKRPDYPER
jgi:Fic family protein